MSTARCRTGEKQIYLSAGSEKPQRHPHARVAIKKVHAICIPPFTFISTSEMADIGAYTSRHLESDVIVRSDVTLIDVVHADKCAARIVRHHTLKKINARN